MKKNELVHYHALLRRIATDFADHDIVTPENFSEYERLDVSPMALRASRDQHEEAVLLLADILSGAARGEKEERFAADESEPESAEEHALPSW